MTSRSTVSLPIVNAEGARPLVGRTSKIEFSVIQEDLKALIEGLGTESENASQPDLLRSYLYAHYHPELKIRPRVQIYQAVKRVLEDENLEQLRDIAGIRQQSAYINTITNVGKRSSYFGGLIGVTVVGWVFLPPVVKFGIVVVAKNVIRKLVPKQNYLIPIDKHLKISSMVGKDPDTIYSGIRAALGSRIRSAGKPVSARIDSTPVDDLVGNLFFRSLIEVSSFNAIAKRDLRARAQISFLYDMARVSRQLEGLARNPNLCWERIFNYTNFAMFLKSMESMEVPIMGMLRDAVETISRARIGSRKRDIRFYMEFERGLKNLNYILQVVEPLDKFNEQDDFDELESKAAKLAFFDQNHLVMERLYIGHENELLKLRPMFLEFRKAALETLPENSKTGDAHFRRFQAQVKSIISSYRRNFLALGKAELHSYDQELVRIRGW